LRDPESREILKKFLLSRQKTKNLSDAQKIVECFELSEGILNGVKDLEENRADIDDLCYDEDWVMVVIYLEKKKPTHFNGFNFQEDRLTNAIDDGTTNSFFDDLMRESAIRLENDPQYVAFKEELRNKLK
jgi:hypothetical protein